MKNTFKFNIWTVAVIILATLWFKNNSTLKDTIDQWKSNYDVVFGEKAALETEVSKLDSALIVSQETVQLTRNELKSSMKSDSIQKELVKHYKKVAAAAKVETITKIDSIKVPYPVYVDKDTTIHMAGECYELDIDFSDDGVSLYDFYMENRQDIVLGDMKKSLWRVEQSLSVRNINPCITTTGITTYQVVVPIKWHQKWWITAPMGFAAGWIVNSLR